MPNDFIINDNIYLVLLRYFEGDIVNINKKTINSLKKGKFNKKEIKPIDKKVIKKLKQILTLEEENPEDYANINWVYPEWSKDQDMVLKKLKEEFPEDYRTEEEPTSEEEKEKDIKSEKEKYKTIIPQRKAYIEWINDVFYKELIKDYKDRPEELSDINIYQYFIKKYLSIETPFRGLLVYHGLGTGKTATSVITAEGFKKMQIYTLLPASLETEFTKEVKEWGDRMYKIEKNHWIFYPINEIKDNLQLRKDLKKNYGIDEEHITQIFNATKSELKKAYNADDPNYSKDISILNNKLKKCKGLFIPNNDLSNVYRDLYTIDGNKIDGYDIPDDKELNILKLDNEQKKYIEHEIYTLIKIKYNFIHYNGFPEVDKFDFQNNKGEVQKKDKLTSNDRMVLDLAEKYKINYDKYSIESPFKNTLIVIDEVHNLVREIINGSGPANVFYNWIINAEDIKLVFLSGTPIINKPAEIAVLYNMLRGSLLVFDFTLLSDEEQ